MATLTSQSQLNKLCKAFAKKHPAFAQIERKYGFPKLWERPATFASLVHIILEQQVSLSSAQATFDKLKKGIQNIQPKRFLKCSDAELLSYGFSRQKTKYCRLLSEAIIAGQLDLDNLATLDFETAKAALCEIKGIGPWTADVWLLMVEGRIDAFPQGDIALQAGWQLLTGLEHRPKSEELLKIAEAWRPSRAIAARLLWQWYLGEKGRL